MSLAHIIMEDNESHVLPSAGWRNKRYRGVIHVAFEVKNQE